MKLTNLSHISAEKKERRQTDAQKRWQILIEEAENTKGMSIEELVQHAPVLRRKYFEKFGK